jgi:hypothetical protein
MEIGYSFRAIRFRDLNGGRVLCQGLRGRLSGGRNEKGNPPYSLRTLKSAHNFGGV